MKAFFEKKKNLDLEFKKINNRYSNDVWQGKN
jgi:hypothetical protein